MNTACLFFSILQVALPWLCAIAFFRPAGPFALLRSCVTGLVVYQLFLFLLSLTLGYLGLLDGATYSILFAGVTVTVAVASLVKTPAIIRALALIRYKPHWPDILILLCLIRAIQLIHNQFFLDWCYGTPGFDGQHYQIPRALQWFWHGDFRPYRAHIWQQLGLSYGGAATLLPPVFMGCGWLGGAYTTLVLSLGACIAVTLICRTFDIGVRASIFAGLVLLSCPTVGLRMIDVSTDVGAAFPVIAAVALVRTSSSLPWSLLIFPALVGLGSAIKVYVAFPAPLLAIALFARSTPKILTSKRAIATGLGGLTIACVFLLLSMWPIYLIFGDFVGGGIGRSLSNMSRGWEGVRRSITHHLLQWSFEPLALLPDTVQATAFTTLRLDKIWAWAGFPFPAHLLMPSIDRERMRALSYSILFLPWLVMGVKRGYRIIVVLGILLLACAQLGPLAENPAGARFTILILAAYSVVWGARAAKSPVIVGAIVLLTLNVQLELARRRNPIREFIPTYQPSIEQNRDLTAEVGSDLVMLIGKGLSLDAIISGRLGNVRFEYTACPADGDWTAHFQGMRPQSRWLMFSARPEDMVPGPDFDTRFSSRCYLTSPQVIKNALIAAGWRFEKRVVGEYELWTHS